MLAEDSHPEPRPRAQVLLRAIDAAFCAADGAIESLVPSRLNPLAHTGAIASAAFLIAAATGILLLPFYSVSAQRAFDSVEAMVAAPFTLGVLRSLHRHSSDLTLLFAGLHGLRLLAAGRFGGARVLSWLTGIGLVVTFWFVGWLGYWLVWDQRAQRVAVGSAKLMDGIPIFADPLSRSFLTNEGLSSLLFFMVFFFHMLIPLAIGVLLWLHISHVSRAKFLPSKGLWVFTAGVLLFAAAFTPARSAPAADMLRPLRELSLDAFFLWPLALSDRLQGGWLWAIGALTLASCLGVPWLLGRGRGRPAKVDTAACNGCTNCYQDCPYDAIRLLPRTDGRAWEVQAEVDPARCVGCGICAGSCDSGAIALPQLPVVDERRRIEGWIAEDVAAGAPPHLAFVCASSAGASLQVDPATGRSEALPGYRILPVPCAGWIQRFTLERALRRGARGALVLGCGPSEPHFREGGTWTELRLEGKREPPLRHEKVEAERIHFAQLSRSRAAELRELAARLLAGSTAPPAPGGAGLRAGGLALLVCAFGALVGFASDLPYRAPATESELVVSFKHAGQTGDVCSEVGEEEKARLPLHMQRDRVCERRRADVRLQVEVDGELIFSGAYPPRGLRADGNSVAVEALPLEPGDRYVRISIGDSPDPDAWAYSASRAVRVEEGARAVVTFDKVLGFQWHMPR